MGVYDFLLAGRPFSHMPIYHVNWRFCSQVDNRCHRCLYLPLSWWIRVGHDFLAHLHVILLNYAAILRRIVCLYYLFLRHCTRVKVGPSRRPLRNGKLLKLAREVRCFILLFGILGPWLGLPARLWPGPSGSRHLYVILLVIGHSLFFCVCVGAGGRWSGKLPGQISTCEHWSRVDADLHVLRRAARIWLLRLF